LSVVILKGEREFFFKNNGLVCFADTFQALIQYPDVVTAQAAKLVSKLFLKKQFRFGTR
jgi:hypothetical protein